MENIRDYIERKKHVLPEDRKMEVMNVVMLTENGYITLFEGVERLKRMAGD